MFSQAVSQKYASAHFLSLLAQTLILFWEAGGSGRQGQDRNEYQLLSRTLHTRVGGWLALAGLAGSWHWPG